MRKILSILAVVVFVGAFSVNSFGVLDNSKSQTGSEQVTPKSSKDAETKKCCAGDVAKQDSTKKCTKKEIADCKVAKKDCTGEKKNCPAKTAEAKGCCPGSTTTAQK